MMMTSGMAVVRFLEKRAEIRREKKSVLGVSNI